MAELRTISVLEKNGLVIGNFTNNLAAYNTVLNSMPESLRRHVTSYSTVNRYVTAVGSYYDLATPVGIFTIKKVHLYKKAL